MSVINENAIAFNYEKLTTALQIFQVDEKNSAHFSNLSEEYH
jgi:hypothetical protein